MSVQAPLPPRWPSSSSRSSGADGDVVIAVMGVTGSGKSSFIKTVTGRSDIQTGDSLFSDTSEITAHRFLHKSTNFILVDTPGFNDSTMSNEEVTTKILQWIESSYRSGTRLDGILYVHNINKSRMEGSANKNLRFFRKLVEGNPFLNVTLATSFWDQVPEAVASSRERELKQSKDFWADMIAKGSEVVRIWPDRAICLQVLEEVRAKVEVKQTYPSSSDSRSPRPYLNSIFERLTLNPNSSKDTSNARKIVMPSSEIRDFEVRIAREKKAEQEAVQRKLREKQAAYEKELRLARKKQEKTLRRQRQQQHKAEERDRRLLEAEQQRRQQELSHIRYVANMQAERERRRQHDIQLENERMEKERMQLLFERQMEECTRRQQEEAEREEAEDIMYEMWVEFQLSL